MKKYFLLSLAAVVLTSVVSFAQGNPYLVVDRPFVGMGLSVSINNEEDANNASSSQINNELRSFDVAPTYGKFISNRWAVGVSFRIGTSDEERTRVQDGSNSTFIRSTTVVGITPFFRRFIPITERFGAYLQPQLPYTYQIGSSESKFRDLNDPANNASSSSIDQSHNISLGVNGGLYYFINQHFSLETNLLNLNLAYNIGSRENTNSSAQSDDNRQSSGTNFQVNLVNQLSLDQIFIFNYYF
ncbi:MAG: hypothetical protein AAF944_00320 [Bacteroidota bacterium]